MAQTGYTPIQLYRTTTAAAVPSNANLSAGELAININDADMALFAENATGDVVRLINNPAGLKYPTADGTSGYAVTTDGSGVLGFSPVGVGDVTLTGTQTLTNKTLEAGTLTNGYTEEVSALGTSGTVALDPANGSIQTCAASGTLTFTDSLATGQSIVLMLTGGDAQAITFPTITWAGPSGNTAPTLTASDVLVFWKVSTTLYGCSVGSAV